jgi:hypothetical protein
MTTYYTYNEEAKQLTPAKRVLKRDGKMLILGHPADFAKYLNAYPRGADTPPAVDAGYRAVPNGYDLKDGKWNRKWKVEPIVYTADNYDRAMEDYIREVRIARGYTTREPDDYFGSSNPRWSQDAKDWVAFRDAVMTYALDVINTYTKTGNAPTLAEFKANFPKMVWTYQEEA